MPTSCKDCKKGHNCKHHQRNGDILASNNENLTYSKTYQVLNLETGGIEQVTMRKGERSKSDMIEVQTATGTCSLCKRFGTVTNYGVMRRRGALYVNLCYDCQDIFSTNIDLISAIRLALR